MVGNGSQQDIGIENTLLPNKGEMSTWVTSTVICAASLICLQLSQLSLTSLSEVSALCWICVFRQNHGFKSQALQKCQDS